MTRARARKLILTVVVVALLWSISDAFTPELLALGWHVLHGKTAQIRSYDGASAYSVSVPLWSLAFLDESASSLGIVIKSGRIRSMLKKPEWGTMTFSVAPLHSTGLELRRAAPLLQSKFEMGMIEVAQFNVAGNDMHCFEQREEQGQAAELARRLAAIDITCVPLSDKRGFSASYIGTRGGLTEFYKVLMSATRSSGRQE